MKALPAILWCGVLAASAAFVASAAAQNEPAVPPVPPVRAVPFKPADPTFFFTFGGMGKATTYADAAALEQAFGKNNAETLGNGVDFATQNLVLVSWTTSGPPDGLLRHEIKGAGKDRRVVFFVQAPASRVRGERARIGADFFAVPKDVAVVFEMKERR